MSPSSEPYPYTLSQCGICKAPILWARTVRRRIPIDLAPRPDGNIVLREPKSPGQPPEARYLRRQAQESLLGEENRYVSHFATCPDSTKWRKDA